MLNLDTENFTITETKVEAYDLFLSEKALQKDCKLQSATRRHDWYRWHNSPKSIIETVKDTKP